MTNRGRLRMTRQTFEIIRTLLAPCGREHKLYAEVGRTGDGYVVGHLYVPGDEDYAVRTPTAVELRNTWMVRTLMEYRDRAPDGILEVHSHPFAAPAFFSGTDDAYIHPIREDFARRNPGGAFLRMVVTPYPREYALQVFDEDAQAFVSVPVVEIVDDAGVERIPQPVCGDERQPEEPRAPAGFERLSAVRTPAEHAAMARAHVVVVGAGGTGWLAGQWLTGLGVGRLTLVDGDRVEEVNLNRLIGVTRSQLASGSHKVECLRSLLTAHDPDRDLQVVPEAFPSPAAVEAISFADAVMCCVDDPLARLDVLRLCAGHLVPAVDVGSSIYRDLDAGREGERHGHAWLYVPGRACWLHMGLMQQGLESPTQRAARRAMGYVVGDDRVSPGSVQTLNGAVVSQGVTMLEAWLLGRRPQHNVLLYEERVSPHLRVSLRQFTVPEQPDCHLCGHDGVQGAGGDPFTYGELDEVPDPSGDAASCSAG